MPPLFLYAIAFLAVLTVVTFVLCRRDDAGESATAAPAAPQGPSRIARAPGATGPGRPAEPMAAASPLRRSSEPLRRRDAPAAASMPGLPGAYAGIAPAVADPAGRIHPAHPASDGARAGETAAIDGLGRQVAELTRQVAALRDERQAIQDEIRSLRAARADMAPPVPGRALQPLRLVEPEPRLQRIGG
jgi:hypothetical protein